MAQDRYKNKDEQQKQNQHYRKAFVFIPETCKLWIKHINWFLLFDINNFVPGNPVYQVLSSKNKCGEFQKVLLANSFPMLVNAIIYKNRIKHEWYQRRSPDQLVFKPYYWIFSVLKGIRSYWIIICVTITKSKFTFSVAPICSLKQLSWIH